MSRSPLGTFSLRSALVAGGTALLVALPPVPAFAGPPPTAVSGVQGAVGDRVLDLSWTGGGSAGAVVREVTGLTGALDPATSGTLVASSGSTAHDRAFTNTRSATYAVWALDSDGTTSDTYATYTQAVAPTVATALTLSLSHVTRPYGLPFSYSGTLTRAGLPVPNQVVDLYTRDGGATTTLLARHLRTAADGTVRGTFQQRRSVNITLRFPGDAFSAPTSSVSRLAQLQPRITARLNPPAIVRLESTVLSGQTTPWYAGAYLVLQERRGTAWHSIAGTRTARNGTYRFTLSPPLGVYVYRVVLVPTPAWVQAASAAVALRVDARDLVRGVSGGDVLALQRRLAALHYDVGPANGAFGYDLQHAVMTFQKVEHLPATGRWTKAERVRVGRPTAWKLRYPTAGTAVEIDITRQVLVLSRAGVVQRILDVSSGSGAVYYQKGVRNIAHTPRGRYAIGRRINALHQSDLGWLYRPVFFYQGYAIHGSDSVPAYPASHGCVRITNPAMDRLFSILVSGVPVSVYDE
jgi:hypothetical protein